MTLHEARETLDDAVSAIVRNGGKSPNLWIRYERARERYALAAVRESQMPKAPEAVTP